MLDIKFIRENKDLVQENCKNRNIKCDIGALLKLDDERRDLIQKIDVFKAEKNKLNDLLKSGGDKNEIIEKGKKVKEELENLEIEFNETIKKFKKLLLQVPNITHPNSPIGKDDSENKELERYGEPPKFSFESKGHEELMKDLDLIDFERAAKVSGGKFYYLKNEGALLEIALVQFAFSKLIQKGFIPFITPDLARNEVLSGIGFNPRGEESQIYNIEGTDLSLVGTAEITMGGYHMDEVIAENKLPLKYAALSHCFRTEAGAYGRHSAGLYRVHQFSKVEMFAYTLPENSEEMHSEFKNMEVEIFKDLGVPFRVVDICTGDLGGPAYRKYDLEAWMTSRNNWGEVTSTSDTTTYQSRRLNIKVERKDGTREFLHMLNGTAIAISRALIAIIENYQQEDGSVLIPEVLKPFMPTKIDKIVKK
ncbi:serine--tRNA ligase [Candidatus Wolfebacteria bacterium CG10_big_fil_rev_8_21_14_0_10_31_9]|uniref:Serine--tRNA ligase n=1 Tax=Candidatus Wolfebacteria bacterium CG10_big_fil_rev_8_21_14_0_10_31_9 TaxID=1975070 RepID=A0A2H0RCR9_9BACT|nr:MAG: serine--tRNA ligase [Candidatus Wolfebacteria bacterium CG10_big_fil_rev_8_21_14_0_10_31_9]